MSDADYPAAAPSDAPKPPLVLPAVGVALAFVAVLTAAAGYPMAAAWLGVSASAFFLAALAPVAGALSR